MAASKSGFMKDALILFAITLVSGLCLGVVYDVTKAPIEAATIAANNATYKQVLPEAESFDDVEGSTEKIAETADEIANLGFGGVAIESVLEAKDASGEVVGHVINSLSNDSYGGAVKLSIGFDADGCDRNNEYDCSAHTSCCLCFLGYTKERAKTEELA